MIEGGCLCGRVRYLDDLSIRAPRYAQFTRDRVSWDVIVGGLPEFHAVPPRDDNDA